MAIQLNNISIGYSSSNIIAANLNLSVGESEMICLIGPNGGGKSTLLKTIAGMQQGLSGEIIINNQPQQKLSFAEKSKEIAVVFTNKIDVENLDVYSAIAIGRAPYTGLMGTLKKEDVLIIEETLRITGLEKFSKKHIDKLSDGERQKVMIGRALAQDCPIILLDEPTAHLDTVNKIEITLLLKKISKEQKKAIVISTHDISLALQTADKVWLMNEGKVLQSTSAEIINTPDFNTAFSGNNFSFDKNSFAFKII